MKTLDAGLLRHQVQIQSAAFALNAAGEQIATWSTIQTLRALVEYQGSYEIMIDGAINTVEQYTVTHRYYAPLTSDMRYVFGELVLEIKSLSADPRKIQMVALCLQRYSLTSAPAIPGRGFFGAGFWRG